MSDAVSVYEVLKVISALTLLRATSVIEIEAPVPESLIFPWKDDGHRIVRVRLHGMGEMTYDGLCDRCGDKLLKGEAVLRKVITTRKQGLSSAFFSPTCLSCMTKDRGGFYSAAVLALVMKT